MGATESYEKHKRKKRFKTCCIITSIVLVVLIIIAIILAFTVFKAKSPKISVNSVKLNDIHASLSSSLKLDLTLIFDLDISVKNPNQASFKYSNSTTNVFYRGTQIGEVPIPAGEILAKKTEKIFTNVTLHVQKFFNSLQIVSDIASGKIVVNTQSRFSGRVNILNIFKHHATTYSTCDITMSITDQSVNEYHCTQKTKL